MKCFITLVLFVAACTAFPLNVVENEEGEQFLLVPLHRERRELKAGANQGGVSIGHTGTFGNRDHQVSTSVGASKGWGSHGARPDSVGAGVGYSHTPSGSSAFAGASRTRGQGTDVSAGGRVNFAGGKNWNAGVSGSYGRHFGGPGGTGKAQTSIGVGVNGKF